MPRPVQVHIEVPIDPLDSVAVVTTGAGHRIHLQLHDVDTALVVAGFFAEILQEVVQVQQGVNVLEARPREREPFNPFEHFLSRTDRKAARQGRGGAYIHQADPPLYGPEERLPIDFPPGSDGP